VEHLIRRGERGTFSSRRRLFGRKQRGKDTSSVTVRHLIVKEKALSGE
jgi:hypothetical protein